MVDQDMERIESPCFKEEPATIVVCPISNAQTRPMKKWAPYPPKSTERLAITWDIFKFIQIPFFFLHFNMKNVRLA